MKRNKLGVYISTYSSRRLLTAALLLTALHGPNAHAGEEEPPTLLLSGYGTLGLLHSSESNADYTNTPTVKPNGAGYSQPWSADVDTRFGLQISENISPNWSAVLQVITQQRYDNSYAPSIEWANISHAMTPDLNIRLGRIAMPTFLAGSYRTVGYATPWARPPVELYGKLLPMTQSDGVDASYRLRFGEINNISQITYGESSINRADGAVANVKEFFGIFNNVEYGAATLRASYQQAELTVAKVNSFFDAFESFGPPGIAIADQYSFERRRISMFALGASYDPGAWFVMTEWGQGKFSSFLGTRTAWYASGGYRVGALTPYLIYSQSSKQGPSASAGLNLAKLPPALVASAARLNGVLNSLLSSTSGNTFSIGSRWDFNKGAAMKLQYDHVSLDTNSSGGLLNIQAGYHPGGSFHVISSTVDFVF